MKYINIPTLIITVYLFITSSYLCAEDVWYKDVASLTNALLLSKVEKKELGFGDTSLLKKASVTLKQNKKIVLDAVKIDPRAFQYADESLKKDKKFVITIVQEHGSSLRFADASLRKDKEVVLAAVLKNGSSLEFADESLRRDKEVVVAALNNTKYTSLTLQWANKSLRNDKDIMLVVVAKDGSLLRFANDRLKKDKDVVLTAVSSMSGARALDNADHTLLKDRDFLLEVVRKLYSRKESAFAGQKSSYDERFRGVYVSRILEKIDDSLKRDKNFIVDIVKNSNFFALTYLDKNLKKDKDFMLELANKTDLGALLFIDESLLKDDDVLMGLESIIRLTVEGTSLKFNDFKDQLILDMKRASQY